MSNTEEGRFGGKTLTATVAIVALASIAGGVVFAAALLSLRGSEPIFADATTVIVAAISAIAGLGAGQAMGQAQQAAIELGAHSTDLGQAVDRMESFSEDLALDEAYPEPQWADDDPAAETF